MRATWHKLLRLWQGSNVNVVEKYRALLAQEPLNAELHLRYAMDAMQAGLTNLANAELQSAKYLGLDAASRSDLAARIANSASELTELDVNQFQRFSVLQAHLEKLLEPGDSILDIGGGHGILSRFMPDNRYFLIEPSVNGISGLELPFPDNCFDVVVSCHVLEHIEAGDRPRFIDELVRVSKKHVLIFNPFKHDDLDEAARLQLLWEVTHAGWAQEHLECGLPELTEITDYLESRGLTCRVKGYGDIYASLATVFMSHFSSSKHAPDVARINRHLNQNYDQLTSSQYPTNIMIEIAKK